MEFVTKMHALFAALALAIFTPIALSAQTDGGKIRITRPGSPATQPEAAAPNIVQQPAEKPAPETASVDLEALEASKKDLWLSIGLSMLVAGGGHAYLGDYTTASILFVGTYGFLGAGIALTMASHQSRTTRLDGEIKRIDTDSNKPTYLVGALCITSSVLLFSGGVISIFLETSDYNRRLERLKRMQNRRRGAQLLPGWEPTFNVYQSSSGEDMVFRAGLTSQRF